jgi:hypothetical protein
MRDWVWRLSFVAVWVVLVVAGLWFFRSVFGYACDDCIGTRDGYFGEGGFKVDWQTVVPVSVIVATFATWALEVWSRAFRRTPGSSV